MKRAGGGRIVLVSSTAGLSASPTAALSYSVTKAAIAALPVCWRWSSLCPRC